MICDPCKRGDHCGEPHVVNTRCFCQHRPRRSGAVAYASVKVDVDPALIKACKDTDTCCPPDACRLDAARAALGAPLTAVPATVVRLDPDPVPAPADDGSRPFVSVLADWMRHHRAGRFPEATALRRVMVDRLTRLGGPDD